MYALDVQNNTWKTLGGDAMGYHADFTQLGDRCYVTLVDNGLHKWWHGDTSWESALPHCSDKGGTPTTLTGTLTFTNGSATVTGSGTNFTGELWQGAWIRKDSSDDYYEVKTIQSNTSLTLMESYGGTTGSSSSAQKAPQLGQMPLFLKVFKGKLWTACDLTSDRFWSRLYWSVTGDPENWSGMGSGYLDVGDAAGKEIITGLGSLDDYLFVFKDFSYYVYRWTGDLDEPVVLVRTFNHGCISHRTIQQVENGLIYLSGGSLRFTNGNDDVDISGSLKEFFETNISSARSFNYFSLGSYDNKYPWAIVDDFRHTYSLFLPDTNGPGWALHYDYLKKQWIGMDHYHNAGHGCLVYGGEALPEFVFADMSPSNQLKKFNTYGDDTTTGYLESATFYSGYPNKKLKIYWVEFGFHPTGGDVQTNVVFNYRKDFGKIDASKDQVYFLKYTVVDRFDRPYIVDVHRFPVNDECRFFSWYLTEQAMGQDDFGIVYWVICYDILESS